MVEEMDAHAVTCFLQALCQPVIDCTWTGITTRMIMAERNDGRIVLDGNDSHATITIPDNVRHAEIHVICEVEDDGAPSLNAYRRVIVKLP